MTHSQSSSSSSMYASPVGRFSSTATGFGMFDDDLGEDGPSSSRRMRNGERKWVRRDKDPRKHEEELINAYEAEEERIVNVLSKKLEQLREDKIDLENALEAESESHVNRLSRELGALRKANRELEERLEEKERLDRDREENHDRSSGSSSKGKGKGKGRSGTSSSEQDGARPKGKKATGRNRMVPGHNTVKRPTNGLARVASGTRTTTTTVFEDTTLVVLTPSAVATPLTVSTSVKQHQHQHRTGTAQDDPSTTLAMDALRRENEQLRTKLVDMEREFGRVRRLNEVYREELIGVRRKLGLPVDNLMGLTPSDRDPFEHPTHVRTRNGKERERDPPSPTPGISMNSVTTSSNSMALAYKPRFVRDAGGPSGYYQQSASASVANGHHTYGHPQIHTTPVTGSMSMPIPRPPSQIRHRLLVDEDRDEPFHGVDGDDGDGDLDDDDDDDDDDPMRSSILGRGRRRPAGVSTTTTTGRNLGNNNHNNHHHNNTVLSPTPSTPSSVSSASLLYPFSDSSPVTSSVLRSGAGGALSGSSRGQDDGGNPASYVSVETDVTSPPSSGSLGMMMMGMHATHAQHNAMHANGGVGGGVGMGGMVMGGIGLGAYGVPQRGLSYPSVPPPSLSSSFGSPSVSAFNAFGGGSGNERGESISPIESRRGSVAGVSGSRRGSVNEARSVPVGARVAETGTLSGGRSRAGSMNPSSTSPSSILREEEEDEVDS